MLISDVVALLLAVRAERGDLEVKAYGYGDIDHHDAAVTVVDGHGARRRTCRSRMPRRLDGYPDR
ncbi:hypothetical protein OG416_35385 (plasmid) [Streptomyces longwoodensis]|uniref:hypothetical protein n=1 Tax=Streptomyces longwoodensis TaxID=68231 RepID=UPI002F908B50|nr:hypothetical protein OG416_35385 [Streptomyces longwoodensis]